jgi:hypothetical protein
MFRHSTRNTLPTVSQTLAAVAFNCKLVAFNASGKEKTMVLRRNDYPRQLIQRDSYDACYASLPLRRQRCPIAAVICVAR